MQKVSRRHQENQTKTKNIVFSNIDEAVKILKETATAKFKGFLIMNNAKSVNSKNLTILFIPFFGF